MIDMHRGAAMAIDTAVRMLRQVAIQAEAVGNRDNAAAIHAAATLVRGLDPIAVIAKAMSGSAHDPQGHGPKDASAVAESDLPPLSPRNPA